MHALRQKLRPKHQVLILKCYPRTIKGAVDVKPNSSELSYLLYYATTRRSKVQKVGAFLEKKTASDVWRARIGNVQVTLQILEALIEKAPRDLPLYAPYVLKILNLILQSKDITMVEATIPTFEAFCQHHDGASLSADQQYLKQYEEIVRIYAAFGSTRQNEVKEQPSTPIAMRWRSAGLKAIKSVASSEALGSIAGRQLSVVMPILYENIWTDNREYLDTLWRRAHMEDKVDTEKLLRRRTSIATVRTVETNETNPLALSGTTADADALAEEEVGVLAVQCLKLIFEANNRTQTRGATVATIRFIGDRVAQEEEVIDEYPGTGEDRGWATSVFNMIARWTPVQDRYIILVTAMESLVRSSPTEENIQQQLVLATMVDSLLQSDINLIGLSVMDVLLGLIQHVLRVLQLGGVDAHLQQRDAPVGLGLKAPSGPSMEPSPSTSVIGAPITETPAEPSVPRIELLNKLQQCIGDLATHVYYADQISDMISTILVRLKPSAQAGGASTAAAIEDPETTAGILANSVNLIEDPNTDTFFSFDTAKVIALRAVKSILLVATKTKMGGAASLSRSRVSTRVWEGTQWLLRDLDGRVRLAYVDALVTWLDREKTTADLRASEEKMTAPLHRTFIRNSGDDSTGSLSKRALSNASQREKPVKPSKTTFLQLLHLAIYENVLQHIDCEADVLLLHLLLTKLVQKLGVNAVKGGLPMIYRLQEDIQEAETMAKVRIGSLCHGYFWTLSEMFEFESSSTGKEIHGEIVRRQRKGFWVDMVRVPAAKLSELGIPGVVTPGRDLSRRKVESESLTPFDNREAMVDLIAQAYAESLASPPISPPTSPGRAISQPILHGVASDPASSEFRLPDKVKEEMLSEWSRESVLAFIRDRSKSASLSGSKAGTNVTAQGRTFLTVNGHAKNGGSNSGTHSPGSTHGRNRSRPRSQAYGLVGGLGAIHMLRAEGSPAPTSDSSRGSVTRVDQLKRVLSGKAPPSRGRGDTLSTASSDSLVSFDVAASDFSFDPRASPNAENIVRRVSNGRPTSKSGDRTGESQGPLTSNPTLTEEVTPEETNEAEDLDVVPPVPPLPAALSLQGTLPSDGIQERVPATVPATEDHIGGDTLRSNKGSRGRGLKSRGGQSTQSSSWGNETGPVVDLESLLRGIETGSGGKNGKPQVSTIIVTRPPY